MIYVIIINHTKFSLSSHLYSSTESQLLLCAPACGYNFHALAIDLHLTFTIPFQSEAHLIESNICGQAFLGK